MHLIIFLLVVVVICYAAGVNNYKDTNWGSGHKVDDLLDRDTNIDKDLVLIYALQWPLLLPKKIYRNIKAWLFGFGKNLEKYRAQ